jgi:CBS domain-containing protein
MIRAKNVISKKITTVTEGVNLKHVMRLLSENKITGVPVVSEDMHLLGIITEKDILKALLYGKDVKSKTAGELMTTHLITFEEDEDLMTIFKTLVEGSFRRVPILSNGRLTGIVSRRDIINFLSERTAESNVS